MNIELPQLITDDEDINRAFRIAYSDIVSSLATHKDGILKEPKEVIYAGLGYDKPWTRDAAINVWNCCGILFPEASRNTLLSVLTEDEHGLRAGGEYWDAIIWITGAWSYFLYTLDLDFLELACKASINTIKYFEETEFDEAINLFRGPACYGDGVAAYPDIYARSGESGIADFVKAFPQYKAEKGEGNPMHTLSTNCLYYNAYVLADKMADVLGEPQMYKEKADRLKTTINKYFWNDEKGLYRYIVDDFGGCDYSEGMGQSFAILFGTADERQTERILQNQHITNEGIPCVYPSFKRYTDYGKNHFGRHSGVIWPHIEAFWADAAASCGRADLMWNEFEHMTRRALRHGHFAEIYHPVTGEIYGGVQERDKRGITLWQSELKQTWSATGYIRILLFGILGMRFENGNIIFDPQMGKLKRLELKNITLRGKKMNINVIEDHAHIEIQQT